MQAAAAKGLVQELSTPSKAALRNNVKTQLAWQLAEKPAVYGSGSSDKVKLTMFMESKCPGCRHFSTTTLKELLDTPGMTDIVDFHAVTWGWANVNEAPTPAQLARNDTAGNIVNTTEPLLSLLQKLGSMGGQAPAFRFQCQHGFAECQGNALEACLQDVEPDTAKFFPVLDCIEARTCAEGMKPPSCVGTPPEVAGGCFEAYGPEVNVHAVMECYNTRRAQQLLVINDMETLAAKPQWVPWFTIDGKPLVTQEQIDQNTTLAFKSQSLMGAKICQLWHEKTGRAPPPACASFPKTIAELPSEAELNRKFPPTNFTDLIAEIAEQKELAVKHEQQGLAWQMQAARNAMMARQERAMEAHEAREAREQQGREAESEHRASTAQGGAGSWLDSLFKGL